MPRTSRDAEFSTFVLAHRADLLRSAYLLAAGDLHRAEDLVQTALTRLYKAWDKASRDGTPGAYAQRILVNAHIDETRRPGWRRENPVPDLPDRVDPSSGEPWLGSTDHVAGDTIRAALAALPAGMRTVVVLRHWLDLTVEESADLIGCSEGTVKSQTAKALTRLRVSLGTGSIPPSAPTTPMERTYR
jgi:RNA polymerase sigma-70 factor (sigma-E family)